MAISAASSPALSTINFTEHSHSKVKTVTSGPDSFKKILNKKLDTSKLQEAKDIEHKREISKKDVKTAMDQVKKTDPAIQEAYTTIMTRIIADPTDEDGMKIAFRKLAKRFENQIIAILWHQALKKDAGSLGEKLWTSERTSAFVESGDDALGEIGQKVYDELVEEMNNAKGINGGE